MLWRYLCYSVGFIFGSIALFGGALVSQYEPYLFTNKIKSQLPIVNGTEAYTRYTQPNAVFQVKLYLFNVTNPDEVAASGAKPRLQQVGPFSLTERRRRKIMKISQDNTSLDYRLYRTYYFDPKDSVPLDSIITLPNAPAFSAIFKAELKKQDEDPAADPVAVLSDYLVNETLYISRPANDWLFEGIKLNWLDGLNADGVVLDDQPIDNKFGIYYKKNDTWDEKADGTMSISTGVDGNFTNIGKVLRWNGKPQVSHWKNTCNIIKGTDGQFFHPNVQKDEKLNIFAPDLCRTLTIEFVKTTSIRSIELYRFGISSDFFKPIDTNEETNCYCVKRSHETRQKFCHLSGVVDVSSCRKSPIVLSTPHFYNGDPMLTQAVEGLSPSAANHDTAIDIEPMTGFALRARRRLQVNVEMNNNEAFAASTNLKGMLIHPLMWLDQSIVIPDELAQKLENKLTKQVRFVRILTYAALITGPIILVATLIFICRDIRREEKNKGFVISGGDYEKVQQNDDKRANKSKNRQRKDPTNTYSIV